MRLAYEAKKESWGMLGIQAFAKVARDSCPEVFDDMAKPGDWSKAWFDCGPQLRVMPKDLMNPLGYSDWRKVQGPATVHLATLFI